MGSQRAIQAAQALAQAHHSQYDPSHDYHHVTRVRGLALALARSLNSARPDSPPVDPLVVDLAALFHDLLDKKYLPKDKPVPSAQQHLATFWNAFTQDEVSDKQRRLVERVVENVSYSKEVKRLEAGEQTEWHLTCPELHCVQDADKLDAMGAFGVMRCAAYSALTNRPLYLPPSHDPPSSSSPPVSGDSAIDHFHDKLFKLEGMIKTPRGRELARKRAETLRAFVDETEREWREAAEGLQL